MSHCLAVPRYGLDNWSESVLSSQSDDQAKPGLTCEDQYFVSGVSQRSLDSVVLTSKPSSPGKPLLGTGLCGVRLGQF